MPDSAISAFSGAVASFYKDLANLQNVLIDDKSMPQILKDRALLLDRIHPNEQGHELIAKNILSLFN